MLGALRVLLLFGAAGLATSCSGLTVQDKLARVGLELVGEEEARVPAPERGRLVPCRTISGAAHPALPHHPAGYLLVKVLGAPGGDGGGEKAILEALESWRPGQTLLLRVRRNPYTMEGTEWWEADVKLRLP